MKNRLFASSLRKTQKFDHHKIIWQRLLSPGLFLIINFINKIVCLKIKTVFEVTYVPTKLTLLFNFYEYIYKGKTWSKRLPSRLFQEFEILTEAAGLFEIREEIIFVKTSTGDLAAQLEAEGNLMEKWKEFLDLLEQTRDAIRDEEFASVSPLVWQMEQLVARMTTQCSQTKKLVIVLKLTFGECLIFQIEQRRP